jgi:hypothetical protein
MAFAGNLHPSFGPGHRYRGRSHGPSADNQIQSSSDDDAEQPAEIRTPEHSGDRSLQQRHEPVLYRPTGSEANQERDDGAPVDVVMKKSAITTPAQGLIQSSRLIIQLSNALANEGEKMK